MNHNQTCPLCGISPIDPVLVKFHKQMKNRLLDYEKRLAAPAVTLEDKARQAHDREYLILLTEYFKEFHDVLHSLEVRLDKILR